MKPSDKRFSTSLVWYHRNNQLPSEGNKILVFSPNYDKDDPFRVRIMDSQFYKLSVDGDWWAYINTPN